MVERGMWFRLAEERYRVAMGSANRLLRRARVPVAFNFTARFGMSRTIVVNVPAQPAQRRQRQVMRGSRKASSCQLGPGSVKPRKDIIWEVGCSEIEGQTSVT